MLQRTWSNKLFSTLGIFGVASPMTGMSPRGMISSDFMGPRPPYMWKFETSRPIGESFTAQDFLRAIMPWAARQMEVKEAPIFAGWILKICRVRYELSPSACVQNFVSIRHSRDLKLFPKSHLPQWKRSCRGKSTHKRRQTPLNRWLHKWLLQAFIRACQLSKKTLITGADVAELVKFQNCITKEQRTASLGESIHWIVSLWRV